MPPESSVLGLKRSSVDDEPSLKRARAVAEEPEDEMPSADLFIDRLVFGIRASATVSDSRQFAESQLRPLLAKTQRQTDATRVLFRALQNVQTKMAKQSEFMASDAERLKEELRNSDARATQAERQVQTLVWQLRSLPVSTGKFGNSFPGPDPGVF